MQEMPKPSAKDDPRSIANAPLAALGLGALGVVFGDIGTSPLYTLKTVLDFTGPHPDAATIMGALSLILWTLFIITSVKYVGFAMRIDNDGEGGIIALLALLGVKRQHRPAIVAVGLFGAALIYGDGAITPAISVLSALEGMEQIAPSLQAYVLPASVAVLFALFALQPLGTAHIGRAFGPIMLVWFAAMAALGLYGLAQHPQVLAAVNPLYGMHYLANGGFKGFLVLGGVFLCVTGAEALYADMGHFGAKPIRLAWHAIVFPSLILNYAGQTAIVLAGAPTDGNIFYRLCPGALLTPLVVLATIATVIASQSIITGAFSMTRQAIQLGWLPRLNIRQTSAEGYGQIYIGAVNWTLMIVTLGLTLGFRKSDNLAAAYGIAVSLTMLMTSILLFIAMREIWNWPPAAAGAVHARVVADLTPIRAFLDLLHSGRIARVPGTAVFLTRARNETPPVLSWHVRQNRALHEYVLALTLSVASTPRVDPGARVMVERVDNKFWRAEAHYGFMQHPDIAAVLAECKAKGAELELDDVTYYVGHETIVPREGGTGIPHWQEAVFAAMERNEARISDYLKLPHDHVVEIGREIAV